MKHTKTDPACIHYKETGPFRRYLNERGRGKACLACVPPRDAVATLIGMAEQMEAISRSGIDDQDELLRANVEAKSYRTAAALIRKIPDPAPVSWIRTRWRDLPADALYCNPRANLHLNCEHVDKIRPTK